MLSSQNYSYWLLEEIDAARLALLGVLEEEDRLLLSEAPALKAEYMEKIGSYEQTVMESELEAALLEKKLELIMKAINRRESVDMTKIEAELETYKKELLKELDLGDMSSGRQSREEWPEEKEKEFQDMYRAILDHFHPTLNPDITKTQRDLYNKAVDAYRRHNFDALQLVYDMLFVKVYLKMTLKLGDDGSKEDANLAAQHRTEYGLADYSLARELYTCFERLESDAILENEAAKYRAEYKRRYIKIEQLMERFPFNARDTLTDPSKTDEYMQQLRLRHEKSKTDIVELMARIDEALEATNG